MLINQNCFQQNNIKLLLDKTIKIYRFLVLPIYWAILTYMLLKPGVENKEYLFMLPGVDKLLHFSIFIFLGWCFKGAFPSLSFTPYILYGVIYAAVTEILQEIMHLGRSMEIFDFVVDVLGLLVANYSFTFFSKFIHTVFVFFKISNPK